MNQPAPPKHGWATFGRICATVLVCVGWMVMLITRPERSLAENIFTGVLMLLFSGIFALFLYLIWSL